SRLRALVRQGTMALMPPHSRIIRFYLGSAPGYEGRMLADIWRWTRLELEGSPNAFNYRFARPFSSSCRPISALMFQRSFANVPATQTWLRVPADWLHRFRHQSTNSTA